jgi:anti-sigma factor RsiW
MLSCREVTDKASDYLDAALPPGQRMALRLHLSVCRHCRRYLRQLRATVAALRHLDGADVSEDTVRHVVERLNNQ